MTESMSKNKAASNQPVQLTASGRPRRICRFPGCTNSVKSQGHCITHGARHKRCKVEGCQSKRQSGYAEMCKRHYNEIHKPKKNKEEEMEVQPQGKSVYDDVLPRSFWWKNGRFPRVAKTEDSKHLSGDEDKEYEIITMMPLAKLLEDNASSPAGWHRRAECVARGIKPPTSNRSHLEEWESQLAIIEMALLVGIEEHSSGDEKWQRLLCYAWGKVDLRKNLMNRVCSRRGDLSRKKRSGTDTTHPEEIRVASSAKEIETSAENSKKRRLEMEARSLDMTLLGDTEGGQPADEEIIDLNEAEGGRSVDAENKQEACNGSADKEVDEASAASSEVGGITIKTENGTSKSEQVVHDRAENAAINNAANKNEDEIAHEDLTPLEGTNETEHIAV